MKRNVTNVEGPLTVAVMGIFIAVAACAILGDRLSIGVMLLVVGLNLAWTCGWDAYNAWRVKKYIRGYLSNLQEQRKKNLGV